MSVPLNNFGQILSLEAVISNSYMYEKRLILDETDGKTLYVAFNQTPNASTASNTWFILKFLYEVIGGDNFLNRIQLPDNGIGFIYNVDDIETYFS